VLRVEFRFTGVLSVGPGHCGVAASASAACATPSGKMTKWRCLNLGLPIETSCDRNCVQHVRLSGEEASEELKGSGE